MIKRLALRTADTLLAAICLVAVAEAFQWGCILNARRLER